MPRRPNGRYHPRIPSNIVYRSIHAAGGPTALCRALNVSMPTVKRWRRLGRVSDAPAVLIWAATVHPTAPEEQLRLARRLAGLPPTHKISATYHAPSGAPDAPAEAAG